jgi:hypothetical protein
MEAILNNLSKEAIDKVEKGLSNYKLSIESNMMDTDSPSIKIGASTTRRPKRRRPVQLKFSDRLGPAPLPDGYFEYTQRQKPVIKAPTSFHEARRIAQESMEYIPSDKNKAPVLRAAGGEIWKDESMSLWADSMLV